MQEYTINLSFIENTSRAVWRKLQSCNPHLEHAKNGSLTLRHRGIYIESRYDPEKQAARLSEGVSCAQKTVIFLGSGLGYHINSLYQRGVHRAVLIEKDPLIFKAALHIIKPEILSNIILLIDERPDRVKEKLQPFFSDKFVAVKHPQSMALHREYYSSVELLLQKSVKEHIASRVTEIKMQRLWVKNILKNLHHSAGSYYGSKGLLEAFNGPVILIASGPSLEDIVGDLFYISKKFPVFALLPSVPFLLKHGIEPDLVVTTDAGFGNVYRFLRNTEIPLMTTFSASPSVLKNWAGRVILFSHGLPFEENLRTVVGASLTIPMQGTSSAVMVVLARHMGFTEIFLAGFDFAYMGLKDHHAGAGFDDHYNAISSRFYTWQTAVASAFKRDIPVINRAGFEKPVYSTHKLMLYKEWMDSEVAGPDLYRMGEGAVMKNVKSFSTPAVYQEEFSRKLDFLQKMREKGDTIISYAAVKEELLKIKAMLRTKGAGVTRQLCRIFYGEATDNTKLEELEESIAFAFKFFL